MGNSPLTVCIHQAWEKQTVQVVLPDGQVLFLPHPLTASTLMEAHPYHFVCKGSPSVHEQRVPKDAKLESNELYYLIPVRPADFPTLKSPPTSSLPASRNINNGGGGLSPKIASTPDEKIRKDSNESLVLDESESFSKVKVGAQQCIINLLVFRQSVTSVMPEESLNGAPPAILTTQKGGPGAIFRDEKAGLTNTAQNYGPSERKKGDAFQPHLSELLGGGNRLTRLEPRHHRASKGRNSNLGLTWRPELPPILENRPWIDLRALSPVEGVSLSMISSFNSGIHSSVKTLSSAPPSPHTSPSPITSAPSSPAPPLRLFQELARPDRSPSLNSTPIPPASPRVHGSTSPRIPSSPSRLYCSALRVPSSPSQVPSSPSRTSRAPTSSLIVGSSPLTASSPGRLPSSQPKRPKSPARVFPSTLQFPSSPARGVQHFPVHYPTSPAPPPDPPMQFPSSPARLPSSPMQFSGTQFPPSPLRFLGSPSVFHPSPLHRACSPAKGHGSPSMRNFQRQRFVYSA